MMIFRLCMLLGNLGAAMWSAYQLGGTMALVFTFNFGAFLMLLRVIKP